MYAKTIKYKDYEGNEREEEFLFNLNQSELVKWYAMDGDYTVDKVIEHVAKKNNNKKTFDMFEELIRLSYGEKSLDGRRFVKNDEVFANFKDTEAYNILFMELISNPEAAVEFITSIIPKDIGEEIRKELASDDKLPNPSMNKAKDFLKQAQKPLELETAQDVADNN